MSNTQVLLEIKTGKKLRDLLVEQWSKTPNLRACGEALGVRGQTLSNWLEQQGLEPSRRGRRGKLRPILPGDPQEVML